MRNLIALCFILLSVNLYAKKVEGYIIDNGDTTQVTLHVKGFLGEVSIAKNDQFIKYSKNGGSKTKIFPKKGLRVVFEDNGYLYNFMSLKEYDSWGETSLSFTHVEYESEDIMVVNAVKTSYNAPTHNPQTGVMSGGGTTKSTFKTFYSVEKGYLHYGMFNFRKRAMAYFSDCPMLVKKIKDKELISYDLHKIAKLYSQCKSDSKE